MVLKAKGRKKRLKTGGSNCLPTTRTSSSILKTTMFFPHLSFFYCYSYRLLTVCWELLKILIWSCSDFFCGLREKLVNERDINNFMFFRFFITFWCDITPGNKWSKSNVHYFYWNMYMSSENSINSSTAQPWF